LYICPSYATSSTSEKPSILSPTERRCPYVHRLESLPLPSFLTPRNTYDTPVVCSLFLDKLESFEIERDYDVSLALLLDLIRRHPRIYELELHPSAILTASLIAASVLSAGITHINTLSVPTTYLYYLCPTCPPHGRGVDDHHR
jgi:hypothetical protein